MSAADVSDGERMSVAGFCELTLETADPDALAAFYAEHLGLDVLQRRADRIWLAAGPRARLGLWRPGRKEFGDEGGAHVHFALRANARAMDEIRGRLADAGFDPRGPVEHEGGDRSLYVEDPEGNVVELWDFYVRGRTAGDELNDEVEM